MERALNITLVNASLGLVPVSLAVELYADADGINTSIVANTTDDFFVVSFVESEKVEVL